MANKIAVAEAAAERSFADAYAILFHALSDPTRLTILRHLVGGEHRVRDLVDHLGLAQSTVRAHLRCLRDCGLSLSSPEDLTKLLTVALPLLPVSEGADLRTHLFAHASQGGA